MSKTIRRKRIKVQSLLEKTKSNLKSEKSADKNERKPAPLHVFDNPSYIKSAFIFKAMNKFKNVAFIILPLCLISSCIISRGNHYRFLGEEHIAKIKELESFDDLNKNYIYEITAEQLLKELENHAQSMVYIFTSGCAENTTSLSDIEEYADQNNLELFLILTGYWQLDYTLTQDIQNQLFSINASTYGNPNKPGYTTKFRNELGFKEYYYAHNKSGHFMIFEGGVLKDMKYSLPSQ